MCSSSAAAPPTGWHKFHENVKSWNLHNSKYETASGPRTGEGTGATLCAARWARVLCLMLSDIVCHVCRWRCNSGQGAPAPLAVLSA